MNSPHPAISPPVDEFNPLDFENFPALIWRSGLDRKCSYFNRTWLEFTGRTIDQERGDGWTEGVHPEDREACFQTYVEAFDKREPFVMDYRLKHRCGEYRWIKDMGTPRHNHHGEFLGYLGSCYDITVERERDRKLQRLNQTKSQLFSLVAHDLTGPIGAMEHLTRALADHCLDPNDVEPTLRVLAASTTSTMRFLEELLTWAKAQMEGFEAATLPVDLGRLLLEASVPLTAGLREKGQSLVFPEGPSVRVQGDPDLLKTVFRNLISNAGKFSPAGAEIRVVWEQTPGRIAVRVEDRGIGIPEGVMEQLTNYGKATSRLGTAGERGSGLGLVICRDFLEAQGGSLSLVSEPGRGTTAVVSLMLAGSPEVLDAEVHEPGLNLPAPDDPGRDRVHPAHLHHTGNPGQEAGMIEGHQGTSVQR